jgi:hypothetical protein
MLEEELKTLKGLLDLLIRVLENDGGGARSWKKNEPYEWEGCYQMEIRLY